MKDIEKLAQSLIEKGLNPRFKYCGFMSPCQIIKRIEEFLPYCEITQGEMTKDKLFICIDFYTVKLTLIFEFKTNEDSIHYIQNIKYGQE